MLNNSNSLWTTHGGEAIPQDWDFYALPPEEIGNVLSAETTLRIGENELNGKQYWFRVLLVSLLFGLSMSAIDRLSLIWFVAGSLLAIPVTAFFFTLFATFEHQCSYVGESGVAVIQLRGNRSRRPVSKMVVFRDAYDAIATYIRYDTDRTKAIEWRRENRRPILALRTQHAWFDFTRRTARFSRVVPAAETAWTNFLSQQLEEKMKQESPVEFRLKRDGLIIVNPGQLSITLARKTTEIRATELKSVSLTRGIFEVCTTDAGFVTSKARTKFRYFDLGNASVFLAVVQSYLAPDRVVVKRSAPILFGLEFGSRE